MNKTSQQGNSHFAFSFHYLKVIIVVISGEWPKRHWSRPLMQLKDRGIKVYVVTTDPSSDSPMALRVASEEGYVFRTNSFSDIEEIEPKITQVITKGTLSPSNAPIKMLSFPIVIS